MQLNTAHAPIDHDLTARELLLLVEIRTATAALRFYPDPPQDDAERGAAIETLAAESLIRAVHDEASGCGGWVATTAAERDE